MRIQPKLIAIVGGSGSGKTWLADRLQRTFGTLASRLSLDDFYLDRSSLPPSRRARINFDHPRAIDWPLAESVLSHCRAGQPVPMPRYSFATHTRITRSEVLSPMPLIICDGLWLFRRPALRAAFDLKIFLDCPAQLRLERRLSRDVAERQRGVESIREQFWKTVAPMHDRFVAPQARWADLVLPQPCDESAIDSLVATIRRVIPGTSSSTPSWPRAFLSPPLATLRTQSTYSALL